jgi:branched-chain amino acid transport system permease protein
LSSELLASALVNGVLNGGLYALLGLAIVLVFRTTAVANFAQGELGMFAGFILLMGFLPLNLPLWLAWLLTIGVSAGMGAAIYLVLLRPRPNAGHLNMTVRTLGFYTLIYAVAVYLWGALEPYRIPTLFGTATVRVLGFAVSYDQVGTVAVTVVMAAAFLLFFRYTQLGLAMRAVAINPDIASLLGINVRRIALAVWIIAGGIGAVVGLLIAPISFLETGLMRPYILKAFTAAIMGGLYSFPGVLLGGIILGIAESFAAVAISIHMREPFVFVVLLLVLLLRPAGILGTVHRGRV